MYSEGLHLTFDGNFKLIQFEHHGSVTSSSVDPVNGKLWVTDARMEEVTSQPMFRLTKGNELCNDFKGNQQPRQEVKHRDVSGIPTYKYCIIILFICNTIIIRIY